MRLLLDQNIPIEVARWLSKARQAWVVNHVNEVGLNGQPDDRVYRWAQDHGAIVITYDEDFADARFYALGGHHGIVRLRVWPTTKEKTIDAMRRLLENIPENSWVGSLIIIDNKKIRVRHA